MKFINYLFEQRENNTAVLVLQKIIDMIDNGHIEVSDTRYSANIGKLIKDSKFSDITLIIRKGPNKSVRLGKNKLDGAFSIVMDVDTLPQRKGIDTFLSKAEITTGFTKAFTDYLNGHFDPKKKIDPEQMTDYEKNRQSGDNFEDNYSALQKAINNTLSEYTRSKRELEKQLKATGSPAQQETLKISIEHIKKELLGSSAKEFTSKILKLPEASFVSHLEKELKDKLTARLASHYESLTP